MAIGPRRRIKVPGFEPPPPPPPPPPEAPPPPPPAPLKKQVATIQKAYIAGEVPVVKASGQLREAERLAGETVHSTAYHIEQMQIGKEATSKGGSLPIEMTPIEAKADAELRRAGASIADAAAVAHLATTGQEGIYRGTSRTWMVTGEGARKVTEADVAGQVGGRSLTPEATGEAIRRYREAQLGFTRTLPVNKVDDRWVYDIDKIKASSTLMKLYDKEVPGATEVLAVEYRRERAIARGAMEVTVKGETRFISAEDANRIKKETPELYKILKDKGYGPYVAAVNAKRFEYQQAQRRQRKFEKTHTELKDGNWVDKQWLADLKKSDPTMHYTLTVRGLDAAMAKYDANVVALDRLKDYTDKEGRVNTVAYLRDNPGDIKTLRAAGFTPAQVKEWQGISGQPYVQISPQEKVWQRVVAAGGANLVWGSPEWVKWTKEHPSLVKAWGKSFTKPMPITTQVSPPMSLDAFISEFMVARGLEPLGATGIGMTNEQRNARELAMMQYARYYGSAALARSGGSASLTFLFVPARITYPEVKVADITPLEWGVGAAQVALIASPFVRMAATPAFAVAAKYGDIAVRVAAGGVFTYATVQGWDKMNEAEKVLAVAIDTVILGSALWGLKPARAGRYAKLIGKVIDTSAKGIKVPPPKVGTKAPVSGKPATVVAELNRARLLTEGGRIGAGWGLADDMALVRAVATGRKPLAMIEGSRLHPEALKLARQLGLKIRLDKRGNFTVNKGDLVWEKGALVKVKQPYQVKSYLIFRDTPTGQLAYQRMMRAYRIDTSTPEGHIRFNTEAGRAFGYTEADIRAYHWNDANVAIAFDANFALKNALYDMSFALRTGDIALLRQVGKRLQLIGAKIPKQLGGGRVVEVGRLLASNPKAYLQLARGRFTTEQLKTIEDNLKSNKRFIDAAERGLRRVKDPARKATIEKVLKEARRQVAVATKVRVQPFIDIKPFPKGKYLPAVYKKPGVPPIARPTKPSAFPGIKQRDKVQVVREDRTITIPISAFRRMTAAQVAKHYGISPEELVWAVAATSPQTQARIQHQINVRVAEEAVARPELAPFPMVRPQPTPLEAIKPATATRPEVAPKPEVKEPIKVTKLKKPKPPIRPRPEMTDKQKRKLISEGKGAFTFRMGELGKERDVWYTYVSPYNKPEHRIVVVGKTPRGAMIVRGPGSAIKTAQMLYGKVIAEKRTDDIGFMDAVFEPMIRRKGIRLSFKPDPKQETIGDFGTPFRLKKAEPISPRVGSITDRRARLSSGRGIRITPRIPALR